MTGSIDRTVGEHEPGELTVTYSARIDGARLGEAIGESELELQEGEDIDVARRLEALATVAYITADVVTQLEIIESVGCGELTSDAEFADSRALGPWLSAAKNAARAAEYARHEAEAAASYARTTLSDAHAHGVTWKQLAETVGISKGSVKRRLAGVEPF